MAKMYAYKVDSAYVDVLTKPECKKAKGIPKKSLKRSLTFEN